MSNGPKDCPRCGGFIAPGDVTVGDMHPECVHQRREDTTSGTVWGPWVAGVTLTVVAAAVALWGWL